MDSIKIRQQVGEDGILHLNIPVGVTDQEMEVVVVYQPVVYQSIESGNIQKEDPPCPYNAIQPLRKFGQFRGQIQIAVDFDDPLPDEFWLGES